MSLATYCALVLLAVPVASDPLSQAVVVVQQGPGVGVMRAQGPTLLRAQTHALVGDRSGRSVGHDGRLETRYARLQLAHRRGEQVVVSQRILEISQIKTLSII